ncbi:MAG: protease modulator HflC, partial [Deltaproteobacteria bacterium]
MKSKSAVFLIILGAIALVAYNSIYIVDETEQVVITQFGRVVGKPIKSPGLKLKVPVIQVVNRFPKYLLEWDGDPGQIPTLDKTFIWVDPFARWRIVDPVAFFQTVTDEFTAKRSLDGIIDPAVRNLITSNPLIEAVRLTNRTLDTYEVGLKDVKKAYNFHVVTGRNKITEKILAQAQPKLTKFGIELVDVKLKRINYVEEVRKSVYGRMIAERKQIAEKFRSEGTGEALEIRGEKEKDLKRINSEAYRTAQEIKGKADAQVTLILAKAFGVDP